ncbi:unnamed protein product [Adineta ricciae]|uniref:Protein BCCIP homolog n=1 Tax=Adineta ricciae TaxID=249248 RepID=A0A816BF98_ADIRI|nr:unnamed protein product [Adineta ricciae]
MPPRSKKRKPNPEPEPSSSSSSSDNDDNSEDETNQLENIQIDLEARSPIDSDRSIILHFLEQSFGSSMKKSVLDLNLLANQLVSQQSCGSVFYQPLDEIEEEDDDDESPVLGICSFLHFNKQQNQQLYTWLMDKCSENSQAKTILQTSTCGLFINERYMNIPAEISVPAIRTLREEITEQLDYWIVHVKLRVDKKDLNTIHYMNGEEEVFEQHASVSIDYQPIQSNANDWIEKRRILFVSTNKLDQICSDIEQKLKQS